MVIDGMGGLNMLVKRRKANGESKTKAMGGRKRRGWTPLVGMFCFALYEIMCGGCAEKVNAVQCGDGTFCPDGFQCVSDGQGGFSCALESCGNGEIDHGEECDDGAENGWSANQCRPDCVSPTCGDGIVDDALGELCDDGNHNLHDACPDGPGGGICQPAACGDGFVWDEEGGSETCDDGNDEIHDNCPSGEQGTCRIARCGDGILQETGSNVEQCDCGEDPDNLPAGCDTINSNSANATCRTDCTLAGCGDGYLDAGEECDDGELNSDTDPNACRLDCREPHCGDGVIDENEDCDDGGENSDTEPDRCRTDCRLHHCGDGVVDSDEQCDAGGQNSDTEPDTCRTDCVSPFCGDGVLDNGEACDCGYDEQNLPVGCSTVNSDEEGTSCLMDCVLPTCGNGVVDPGEECDNGTNNSDTAPDACRMNCLLPSCGDDVIDSGEECDDGAVDTADCDADCTFAECGDGYRNTEAGESCDCGVDPQDLPQNCTFINSDDEPNACRTDCTGSGCGDGVVDNGEDCDSAGVDTATCDGGNCTFAECGDGYLNTQNNEECDDGANNSNTVPDACRQNCKDPWCGDGVTDTGEQCDSSGTDTAACNGGTCQNSQCGDGYVNGADGEQCDTSGVDTAACNGGTCQNSQCGDGYVNGADGEQCDSSGVDTSTCNGGTCQNSQCGDGYVNGADGEQCDTSGVDTTTCNGGTCQNSQCGDGYVNGADGEQCDTSGVDTSSCNGGTCQSSQCGDGYVNGADGEQCDTSGVDTTTCNGGTCQNSQCGDGYVNGADGEQCDTSGVDTAACNGGTCQSSQCGDGYVNAADSEQCDGSNLDGENCGSLGYYGGTLSCTAACQFNLTSCQAAGWCGDGIMQSANGEQCDATDFGGETCISLSYYGGTLACTSACGYDLSSCEAAGRCGDGAVQTGEGEQCDGSNMNGETCGSLGYYGGTLSCDGSCNYDLSSCQAAGWCGDGDVNGSEDCDGSNLNSQTCISLGYYGGTLSCNGSCSYDLSSCQSAGWCGDGNIQTGEGEECDGSNLNGETCGSLGYYGGTLSCDGSCGYDLSSCESAGWCGDGDVQTGEGEQCDGSNLNGETCGTQGYYWGSLSCDTSCNLDLSSCSGYCGDGTRQASQGEQCDDGVNNSDTVPDACRTNCQNPGCGDGVVDSGEDCDGSNLDGQTCGDFGYYGGNLLCDSCSFDFDDCEDYGWCGDGDVQAGEGEECDGSNLNGETCGSLGYYGGSLSCDGGCGFDLSSCESAGWCGDGDVQTGEGEECDGSNLNGETCGSLGYYGGSLSCDGVCGYDTSSCESAGWCGDGDVQTGEGEECDGSNLNGETCGSLGYYGGSLSCDGGCGFDLSSCESAGWCGDGDVQTGEGEECDGSNLDGNTCVDLGYSGGTLGCLGDCQYDESGCS
jgi:hypothetical protein